MATEDLLAQGTHFAFGRNWEDYAANIDDARIDQAVAALRRLAGGQGMQGKTFLDIGCGSGLHVLAALRLGAKRVLAIDIDPDSVATARDVVSQFAPNAVVDFEVRSVFDMAQDQYGTFDIVYSWGVLHHTGDMNRAIAIASALVAPDGEFLVALYRKTPFCTMWRVIKRWYSRTGPAGQLHAQRIYTLLQRLASNLRGRDFDAHMRSYQTRRGMSFYHDVHDWLGGYPYQSISPIECHALLSDLGFEVAREFIVKPSRFSLGLLGSGCDEYAFRRAGGAEPA